MKYLVLLLVVFTNLTFANEYEFESIDKSFWKKINDSRDAALKNKYDDTLVAQRKMTREFLEDNDRMVLASVLTSDTSVGGEGLDRRRRSLRTILNDNFVVLNRLSNSSVPRSRSLTYKQAHSFLKMSKSICRTSIKGSGMCFMRATHMVQELAENHSKVPTLKVWIIGDFNGWRYHVAPMIPVYTNGKVDWYVLDSVIGRPRKFDTWVHHWLREGADSETRIDISFSTKFGIYNVGMEAPFSDISYHEDQTAWEALRAADRKQ